MEGNFYHAQIHEDSGGRQYSHDLLVIAGSEAEARQIARQEVKGWYPSLAVLRHRDEDSTMFMGGIAVELYELMPTTAEEFTDFLFKQAIRNPKKYTIKRRA